MNSVKTTNSASANITAINNQDYNPENPTTITTDHNATGVISSGDVGIKLINVTNGNNTEIAVNNSSSNPVQGQLTTTVPAGVLSGDVQIEAQLYNISTGSIVATTKINLTANPKSPHVDAPNSIHYKPTQSITVTTDHNATGVISSGDIGIRLVNVTDGNNTPVALNNSQSIPIEGQVNTTIAPGDVSGDVQIEVQLFDIFANSIEATTTINLTAHSVGSPSINAVNNMDYIPRQSTTIRTNHNATGVISNSNIGIRLVNVTGNSNTPITLNNSQSIPTEGQVNTTISAGDLSGDVQIEAQLYNVLTGSVEATTIINLTAHPINPGSPSIGIQNTNTYVPDQNTIIRTSHNATDVITNVDVGIKIVNITNGTNRPLAVNVSQTVPVQGQINSTISAGALSGDAQIEAQLYNISTGKIEATDTINLTVSGPGDITGNGMRATDPDGDGVYEDINGDGNANLADLQPFFSLVRPSASAPSNPSFFDVNGDGQAGLQDLQPFFNKVRP